MTKLPVIIMIVLTCATSFAQSVIVKGTGAGNVYRAGTGAGSVRGVVIAAPDPPITFDYYVSTNGSHISPFDTWAKAATNIQDAVSIATNSETVVISNGIYYLATQITVTKAITIQSKDNNPTNVIVDGQSTVRCFNMGSTNAWLIGLTVQNGNLENFDFYNGAGILSGSASNCILNGNKTWASGGGASGAVLYNCTLTGNDAGGGGYGGGGANGGTLYNCTLTGNDAGMGGGAYGAVLYGCIFTGNSASADGGGANGGTLYNCTLTGNDALDSGGVRDSILYNCISWDNGVNLDYNVTEYYSCGINFTNGIGSITNNPLFVGGGDYRLQVGSPCINTGTNQAWMLGVSDLDGNKRIWPVDGTVDMGAYEYNSEP